MQKRKRKKCRNCGCFFIQNPRKKGQHFYCGKFECRQASKKASQKKWRDKPENRDYFRGPDHVKRVQEWRRKNPGYSQRTNKANTLQDLLSTQSIENKSDLSDFVTPALQDLLLRQPPVIIGLISNFIGSALQDEIASTLLRMEQSGQDILSLQSQRRGGTHEGKITCYPGTDTQNPQELQLGRPPTGAR